MTHVGRAMRRREDPPLLRGQGRFLDDLRIDGVAHVVFVRSPHAHARVAALDVDAARKAPGVVAVVVGADVDAFPPIGMIRAIEGMVVPEMLYVADDVVRCQGTPVAAVVADSAVLAHDAAGLVRVEWTPLPGVDVRVAADGEVLARGPNVFKGYWENEEATRAVLDKDGWYHTGDLGEFDKDGFLWLRGRKKDMIVLADGTNVYPEDIENMFAADPRIEALATPLRPAVATVVGLQRPGEDVQVHAVFLVKDKEQVASIVRDTNVRLSGSQQVRGWTIWPEEEFPTTPTQKVKKRFVVERLLAMGRVDQARAVTGDLPSTRTLTEVEQVPPQGTMPRQFAIDPTGAYLFAANELTGNVVLFRVDSSTGRLSPTKTELKIDVPVCIVLVAAQR